VGIDGRLGAFHERGRVRVTEWQQRSGGSEMMRMIRVVSKPSHAGLAAEQSFELIRARLHSELYRREREHYPEYIDHGGEG
jgi:hypothetical protein